MKHFVRLPLSYYEFSRFGLTSYLEKIKMPFDKYNYYVIYDGYYSYRHYFGNGAFSIPAIFKSYSDLINFNTNSTNWDDNDALLFKSILDGVKQCPVELENLRCTKKILTFNSSIDDIIASDISIDSFINTINCTSANLEILLSNGYYDQNQLKSYFKYIYNPSENLKAMYKLMCL